MKSMYEYVKVVLTKVSFDRKLFRKELRKALEWLTPEEIPQLKSWCIEQYGTVHGHVIEVCFRWLKMRGASKGMSA